MKRIALMVIRLFYIVPYWFIKLCIMGNSDKYDEEMRYQFLHNLVKKVNKAGRVTIISKGAENLPKEKGYVIFPNHQGMFDVLAIMEACPKPFTVVLKEELNHVILVKQVIRFLKAQTLERGNPRDSIKVIKQMTQEVLEGRNYLIFAEGTRSLNGNKTSEFKGGSFKSAINAKCPIVPIALIDAFKPFDSSSLEKLTVQVHILPAIYYDEYQGLKSKEIAAIVKSRIEETIQTFQKEN